MYNLGFFGSRTLKGEDVEEIIEKEIQKRKPTSIVTALEPGGVCASVFKTLRKKRYGIPVIAWSLDEKRCQGMYDARSRKVLNICNHMVFIHDGTSKGTLNEMAIAKKLKVSYSYYKATQETEDRSEEEWESSIESMFEIENKNTRKWEHDNT